MDYIQFNILKTYKLEFSIQNLKIGVKEKERVHIT